MQNIKLHRVGYMPRVLEPDILYFSEEFSIAAHLCACGCGNKTVTPLGPTDWELTIVNEKPTLDPSIGNWPLPCKSHYFIRNGVVLWSGEWSDEEISAGRQREANRREIYYNKLRQIPKKRSVFERIFDWIFRRK